MKLLLPENLASSDIQLSRGDNGPHLQLSRGIDPYPAFWWGGGGGWSDPGISSFLGPFSSLWDASSFWPNQPSEFTI